jgi:DNA-binding response OmpR family regulator
MSGGAHHCESCADKDERIAWLESELGLQRSDTSYDNLRAYLRGRARGDRRGTPCVSRLILALYRSGGRVMSTEQIMEAVPPLAGTMLEDLRDAAIVKVWVCYARRCLGREAIENAWGRGYRMSAAGLQLVAEIIRDTTRVAA